MLSAEKTEAYMIQVLNELGFCVNMRSEGEGSYGRGKRASAISEERPAGFYLVPVKPVITNVKEYQVDMSDKDAILLAERNH